MELKVKQLSFAYEKERPVLNELSFHLNEGCFLAVLGPNGAGKSTLFRCLLGMLPRYTGDILIDGRELRTLSTLERAEKIAYIPQLHRQVFGYSVLETVLMGLSGSIHPLSQPSYKHRQQALEALSMLHMEDYAPRAFQKLSGGEQQLVLIARALAQKSRLLIMDEPTASLDYGNRYLVLEQVRRLSAEGYSILLSTHDPQQALSFAHKVLALKGGRCLSFGDCQQTLTPRLLYQLYGIEATLLSLPQGPVLLPTGRRNSP